MQKDTVLIAGVPGERQRRLLDGLPPEVEIVAGDSAGELLPAAARATVLLYWSAGAAMLREVFLAAPGLRWVHARSAGLDGILFPELRAGAVPLTNSSGVFSPSLGEFALAAILYFAKDLRRMLQNQAAGVWAPFEVGIIEGRTVAIVGYGSIGREVARRVRAMGMRVLATRRNPQATPDALVDEVHPPEGLRAVLARADYVVVAAPLTPETRHLLGEAEFAAMKPSAVLVNIGRGPVVDEAALVRALAEGRIRGAALDVFEREPLPAESPLYGMENVLVSPHCADNTVATDDTLGWQEQTMAFFVQQLARYRAGEPLLNVVDKQRGY